MSNSSLVENLEKAAEANEALIVLIAEAHTAIKTLRRTERECIESINRAVDKHTSDALKPILDEMTVTVRGRLTGAVDHVMKEFAKVADPLMAAMDMIEQHSKKPGGFFDR